MDLEESLSVSTLTVCWVLFVSGLFLALYLFITA
jgi:hypothetical protein